MGKKRLAVLGVLLCLALLLFSSSLPAAEIGKGVKVTFMGHAAFKLVSPQGNEGKLIVMNPGQTIE